MSPASHTASPQPGGVVSGSNHDALRREDESPYSPFHDTTRTSGVPDMPPTQTTIESAYTLDARIDTVEKLVAAFVGDVDELLKQAVDLNADLDAMLDPRQAKE